ncbi:hypothetical protein ACH0BF_20240 [Pseudobacillus sp. 179-B 2D1 NHS]|uniref:hypothetical protein n=1 Tax=Pseudobacillus sp. 179-B 2D1 NHS TaxID=3374292 RepID=UPI0038794205
MVLKQAAEVGDAVKALLTEEELTVEQMSMDLNISKQLGSHIKNDRRRMQQDIAKQSIRVYEDSPEYIGELLYEFSDGYTSPVLKGPAIERHRLAVEANAERELSEALEKIRTVCLAKPPSIVDENEKEGIAQLMDELLEARAFIDNLNMMLEKDYGIPIKKRIRKLLPQWKAKGWI